MKESPPDQNWLKEVMADAQRDISQLPEAFRRLPPRSKTLAHLRASRANGSPSAKDKAVVTKS